MPEDSILGLRFMHEYTRSANKSLKLNLHEHELFDDGIFLPPNQTRLVRIPVDKHEGHFIIFDNPHVPDSIFKIQNQTITIPYILSSKECHSVLKMPQRLSNE